MHPISKLKVGDVFTIESGASVPQDVIDAKLQFTVKSINDDGSISLYLPKDIIKSHVKKYKK